LASQSPATLGRMATTEPDAAAAIEAYLDALDGETRRVASGEWGLSLDAAGWPLHVGVALRDGLLRAQAEVVEPGRIDDHVLLHWNRSLPLVRFSHSGAGAVWVQGDLPLEAVSAKRLDEFLGLLVRVAIQARESVNH
jgi:putative sensory transduction regulator